MDNCLPNFQCGFRKGSSAQHSLLAVIEKWKKVAENGKLYGTLLTDLSTTFDCSSYELITHHITHHMNS